MRILPSCILYNIWVKSHLGSWIRQQSIAVFVAVFAFCIIALIGDAAVWVECRTVLPWSPKYFEPRSQTHEVLITHAFETEFETFLGNDVFWVLHLSSQSVWYVCAYYIIVFVGPATDCLPEDLPRQQAAALRHNASNAHYWYRRNRNLRLVLHLVAHGVSSQTAPHWSWSCLMRWHCPAF